MGLGALHEPKVVQGCEACAVRKQLENRAVRRPVESTIVALYQRSVRNGQAVENRVSGAVRQHLEHRAEAFGSADAGSPVEHAIAVLNQRRVWSAAVCSSAKAVEDDEAAAVGTHSEDRAVVTRAAGERRPIKEAVAALNEAGVRTVDVRGRAETVEDLERNLRTGHCGPDESSDNPDGFESACDEPVICLSDHFWRSFSLVE